jgi:MFS family permease
LYKQHTDEPPYPKAVYSWYVIIVLFMAYTLSFVDRQIMALMIEPIKRDLAISDTQISLLHGFAFAIFYTILGVPLGRLADKRNRCLIISVGIFMWSIMTAACGLAKSFLQLFLTRVGVGVGEASLSPAAYSMISDYFPKEKRGLAISLYSMGVFFGAGMSFLLGGLVVRMTSNAPEILLPVIGQVHSWQLTFFIVGIPGLLFVTLMTTVREPFRRDLLVKEGTSSKLPVSITESAKYLLTYRKAYFSHLLGFSLMGTLTYGFFAWTPSYFIRTFQWTSSEIGFVFGLIVLIIGTSGIVLGVIIADKWLRRGALDSYLRVTMFAALGILIFGCLAALMPNSVLALIFLCPTICLLGFPVGLAPASLNFITPNQLRGQAISLYLFLLNLIGLGFGPTAVALITDYIFKNTSALRYSLAIFTFIIALFAMVVFLRGLKHYRKMAQRTIDA